MRSTIPGFCRDMPWLLYGHASDFVGTCMKQVPTANVPKPNGTQKT